MIFLIANDNGLPGKNVSLLTSNMTEAFKNLRMLLTLQPDGPDKIKLLAAAYGLAGATQDLLKAAKVIRANPAAQEAAIISMFDANREMLGCLSGVPVTESDIEIQMLDQAKLVAQANGKLFRVCEEMARSCSDHDVKRQVT